MKKQDMVTIIGNKMDLEKLPSEYLKAKIKLMQEVLEKREEKNKPPQSLPSDYWNIFPISELAEEYIKDVWPTGFVNEDYQQGIFQCAIEMIFGKDIWDKIWERQK